VTKESTVLKKTSSVDLMHGGERERGEGSASPLLMTARGGKKRSEKGRYASAAQPLLSPKKKEKKASRLVAERLCGFWEGNRSTLKGGNASPSAGKGPSITNERPFRSLHRKLIGFAEESSPGRRDVRSAAKRLCKRWKEDRQ